jgi:hypothetical protein
MKEQVLVKPDLTLIYFDTSATMRNRKLKMTGKVRDKQLVVFIDIEGEKLERQIDIPERIYHASAVELMPALKGLRDGAKYSFKVFNPEKQKLANIEQSIRKVKKGLGPEDAAWHVKVKYDKAEVDAWLNHEGQTILSKSSGGAIVSKLEDKEKAMAASKGEGEGSDIFRDQSLIKADKLIPGSEKTSFLKARMSGIDSAIIPGDHRQTVFSGHIKEPTDPFGIEVNVEDLKVLTKRNRPLPETSARQHLESSSKYDSKDQLIVAKAKEITSKADSRIQKVEQLVKWTAENIKNSEREALNSIEVLRAREGECQAHAILYIALARALGIPTRIVYGLVYSDKGGFLYHAWAESYVNGWLAVDPTLNQVPADATHIKLFTGESAFHRDTLLGTVGKVRMEIVDFR